jgi:hypothetical protein
MPRKRGLTHRASPRRRYKTTVCQNFSSGKCPYGRRCKCQATVACALTSHLRCKTSHRCNFIHSNELPTPPFGPSAACLPSSQQLLSPQLLSPQLLNPQQLGPASPAALLLYSYFYPSMPTELPTVGRAPPMPPSRAPSPMPPMSPAAPRFTPRSMPPMSPAALPFTPKPRAPPGMVTRSPWTSARWRLSDCASSGVRTVTALGAAQHPEGPTERPATASGTRELAASEVADSTAFFTLQASVATRAIFLTTTCANA